MIKADRLLVFATKTLTHGYHHHLHPVAMQPRPLAVQNLNSQRLEIKETYSLPVGILITLNINLLL